MYFDLTSHNGWGVWEWVGVFEVPRNAGDLWGLREERVSKGLGFAIVSVDLFGEAVCVIDFQGGYAWVSPVSCRFFYIAVCCPYVAGGGLFQVVCPVFSFCLYYCLSIFVSGVAEFSVGWVIIQGSVSVRGLT